MIDTNYNVVYLPISVANNYKICDKFVVKGLSRYKSKHMKFDGLEIKAIDFQLWCVRLHFDWNEWKENKKKMDGNLFVKRPINIAY